MPAHSNSVTNLKPAAINAAEYQQRRHKLLEQLPLASLAIVPAASIRYRNADTGYRFRQDSDFYYLTGCMEPEAVALLVKSVTGETRYILLVAAKDPEAELWEGTRLGPDRAREFLLADEAYAVAEFEALVRRLLVQAAYVYYPVARNMALDRKLLRWHQEVRFRGFSPAVPTGGRMLAEIQPLVAQLRLYKSQAELAHLRWVNQVSAAAHMRVLGFCAAAAIGDPMAEPLYEYQLEAEFHHHCALSHCRELAYPAIVAAGANGCILHYHANDQPLHAGDLVLIDAGAEYAGYAADITRTFPSSGRFTSEQKAIYELVLQAQTAAIAMVAPGVLRSAIHEQVVAIITEGLQQLGLLPATNSVAELIANKAYRRFYMHSTGHFIGLDVHDPGIEPQLAAEVVNTKLVNGKTEAIGLQPGMVLTIEPGIYIAAAKDIAPEWHNIAVRIEDVVAVTATGAEVLSAGALKSVAEIEAWMQK